MGFPPNALFWVCTTLCKGVWGFGGGLKIVVGFLGGWGEGHHAICVVDMVLFLGGTFVFPPSLVFALLGPPHLNNYYCYCHAIAFHRSYKLITAFSKVQNTRGFKSNIHQLFLENMGFTKTLRKRTSSLNPAKPTSPPSSSSSASPAAQFPQPTEYADSEEDLISAQLPLPRSLGQTQYTSETALYRPTSQIICHSPLDKRNKSKKGRHGGIGRKSGESDIGGVGSGSGSGSRRRFTTSTVLFSSTRHDVVELGGGSVRFGGR